MSGLDPLSPRRQPVSPHRRTALTLSAAVAVTALAGCSTDADVASRNLSQEADQFKVARRVVFYNGITDRYILSIEGNCSVMPRPADRIVDVVCKLPDGSFIKHSEGLADNTTYFSQQLTGVDVSTLRYAVVFKPESLIPDFDRPSNPSAPADKPAPR